MSLFIQRFFYLFIFYLIYTLIHDKKKRLLAEERQLGQKKVNRKI